MEPTRPESSHVLFEVGQELQGRYRLDRRLGSGGMGEVWQAYDLRLRRKVAVKGLRRGVAADPRFLALFNREGEAAGRLLHPAVVMVFDIGEHAGHTFMVFEYLDGKNLNEVLKSRPAGLGIDLVLNIGTQVAEGLAALHSVGVIHLDIKPHNLMLLAGNQAKICDLGIAHVEGATAGLTRPGIGTPAYMAPEQHKSGQLIDNRADLYALGATMFHLLTGRIAQSLPERPPRASALGHDIPEDLDTYLQFLLAEMPAHRPDSAVSVAQRLRALAGQHPQPSTEDPAHGDITDPRAQVEALQQLATMLQDPSQWANAERLAFRIPRPSLHEAMLVSIAKTVATRDSDHAESLARRITYRPRRIEALEAIAQVVASRDMRRARELLAEIARLKTEATGPDRE